MRAVRSRTGGWSPPKCGALVAGVTVACSALLVGCTSSTPAPPPVRDKTVAITPGRAVPFAQARNARFDVTAGACTPSSGSWVLHGTVRNPTLGATTFQIVVDFVTRIGSTVLATTVVDVPSVAPGATVHWSTTGAHHASDVACVVRQAQTI